MNLFTVFLQGALGWALGKILDVGIECFRCGQRDDERIGNQQSNYIECSNCHKVLNQFTNACKFTVNRQTGQIGHGVFCPGDSKWKWIKKGWGFFKEPRYYLGIPFNLMLDGLKGRSVVLETRLLRYSDEGLITSYEEVFDPSYDSSIWKNFNQIFGDYRFEQKDKSIIIAESLLCSEYKDILFEDRRIIEPWTL